MKLSTLQNPTNVQTINRPILRMTVKPARFANSHCLFSLILNYQIKPLYYCRST
jgi:hypothetical protein